MEGIARKSAKRRLDCRRSTGCLRQTTLAGRLRDLEFAQRHHHPTHRRNYVAKMAGPVADLPRKSAPFVAGEPLRNLVDTELLGY